VSLWQKMGQATGGKDGLAFLSTHPSGPDRIRELQQNVPTPSRACTKPRQNG
jgi:Zn-dependent protease with chaperone function